MNCLGHFCPFAGEDRIRLQAACWSRTSNRYPNLLSWLGLFRVWTPLFSTPHPRVADPFIL
jgi:hypothetical protein